MEKKGDCHARSAVTGVRAPSCRFYRTKDESQCKMIHKRKVAKDEGGEKINKKQREEHNEGGEMGCVQLFIRHL